MPINGLTGKPHFPILPRSGIKPTAAQENKIYVSSRSELIIGIGCALMVVVLWSSFLVLSRYVVFGLLTSFDLAALRFGVSGIIMLSVLLKFLFGGPHGF